MPDRPVTKSWIAAHQERDHVVAAATLPLAGHAEHGDAVAHAASRPAPDLVRDVGERGDVRGTWRPETE